MLLGCQLVKPYLSIRVNWMVVRHIRSRLANEFMNESQHEALAYKPQAATNRKTRDYHRFPHDGKPECRRMNAEPFESRSKYKLDFQEYLWITVELIESYPQTLAACLFFWQP